MRLIAGNPADARDFSLKEFPGLPRSIKEAWLGRFKASTVDQNMSNLAPYIKESADTFFLHYEHNNKLQFEGRMP
jgi:hypothetical protein